MNVTMGIPRLREIVMTASKAIKSPIMYLPILASANQEQAAVVASKMCKVTLFNCLDEIQVFECLRRKDPHAPLMRVYRLILTIGYASSQNKFGVCFFFIATVVSSRTSIFLFFVVRIQ